VNLDGLSFNEQALVHRFTALCPLHLFLGYSILLDFPLSVAFLSLHLLFALRRLLGYFFVADFTYSGFFFDSDAPKHTSEPMNGWTNLDAVTTVDVHELYGRVIAFQPHEHEHEK
jgi:hypothetical protein